jgi:hypothetical protein
MSYVRQKKMEQDLEYEIKNLERKIEIVSLSYNKIVKETKKMI